MSFSNIEKQLPDFLTDVFFETGTYYGYATRAACRIGFKRVITVEINSYNYNEAKKQCVGFDNIEFYLGCSTEVLKNVLPKINDKITFFLDAHPGDTNQVCPLYKELDIIKEHKRNDHIIIIDDMRFFNNETAWGTIDTIKEKLLKINPEYNFSYIDGCITNDMLVAKL